MKWLNPNGSTQHSADHRYAVVQAVEGKWIAYRLHQTTGDELGIGNTDTEARQVCEDHERDIEALRKRA